MKSDKSHFDCPCRVRLMLIRCRCTRVISRVRAIDRPTHRLATLITTFSFGLIACGRDPPFGGPKALHWPFVFVSRRIAGNRQQSTTDDGRNGVACLLLLLPGGTLIQFKDRHGAFLAKRGWRWAVAAGWTCIVSAPHITEKNVFRKLPTARRARFHFGPAS
jgi:hypothetical protein